MKRKWIKWVSWILLTPLILFVILMVLLYIPSVQNFLRKEAAAYASEATGMQINVRRIDLRFLLILWFGEFKASMVPIHYFHLKASMYMCRHFRFSVARLR